jgi:hypothetical protein
MKPVKAFFGLGVAGDSVGKALSDRYGVEWSTEVFEAVSTR